MNRTEIENLVLSYNVRVDGNIRAAFFDFKDSVIFAQDLVKRNPAKKVEVMLFDKITQFHHDSKG